MRLACLTLRYARSGFRHVLVNIDINAEGRVEQEDQPDLRLFLVVNEAYVTAESVGSPE